MYDGLENFNLDTQTDGKNIYLAIDKTHPFKFLFKWNGEMDGDVKKGTLIPKTPYFISEALANRLNDSTPIYNEDTVITDVLVNQEHPDTVLVCPANCSITFNNAAYKLEGNVSVVQGTEAQYKAYALHYVRDEIILVNCSLYG